jgi:hypothetical protein
VKLEPTRKREVRDLARDVDEVLFWIWDPIGVNDTFCARGEYGDYALQVVKLLLEDVSEESKTEAIVAYLDKVATDTIGLPLKPENSKEAAERMLDAYDAWKSGLR